MDSGRLRHGMAFRTSIFGDCPHLHPSGDRNGASLLIGDGSALHLDLSGLSITDEILGIYSVTITRITCDYNLLVSVNSRYLNYVKE